MNSNSTEENNQNLAENLTDAILRKSYPIDFSLHDDEGKNILYIDDASGDHNHNLYLEILNTSTRNIQIIKDSLLERSKDTISEGFKYPASQKYHHFELRFRPGVLHLPDAIILKDSQDWKIGNQQHDDKTVSLYFLYKHEKTTLAADKKLVLTLQNIKPSVGYGASRTQVELNYRNLRYQGEKENFPPVPRLQILNIINHYGKKDIHLRAGFISGNHILNDGSANELHLRISNITLATIPFKSPSSQESPKLILSFDTGDAQTSPWALGTKSQISSIKVEVKYPKLNMNEWKSVNILSDEGIAPQWEIKIPSSLQQLEPGEFFEVKLSDIKTTHPLGHTNLYLRYENIPGYWDGQFVCSMEKAPFLYRNNKIGINTTNPQIDLAIGHQHTGLHHPSSGELAIHTNGAERLRIDNSGHLGINTTNPQIDLAIGHQRTGLHHPNSGELSIHTNGAERLRIDNSGNVSIGTATSGGAKLKVSGTADVQQLKVSGTADVQQLKVSGAADVQQLKVSGAADVQQLKVSGAADVQGLKVNSSYMFKKIQAGRTELKKVDLKQYIEDNITTYEGKVSFPEKDHFSNAPCVIVTARNEKPGYKDVFAVTVSDTDTKHFLVKIIRIGFSTQPGWLQNLSLDWIAWET